MITIARGDLGVTPARVLEQVRAGGVVTRDELVARTGLSSATVGRIVTSLVEAGVLRERHDRIRVGAVGRPGIPVEIDPDRFVVVGIHIGRRVSTVAIGDLAGRVITHETVSTGPTTEARSTTEPPDLELLARTAARLLGTLPSRAPLAAGLVAPWRDLGIGAAAYAGELGELTGLEVHTGDHIAAVAASEFFHRRHGTTGVTLYVYARETIGFAVAVDKGSTVEVSRVGSLTHFPTDTDVPCACGRTGCLGRVAGDAAVVGAARADGLLDGTGIDGLYARSKEPRVLALLRERARRLGQVAGVVRDMTAPDRVVLVGQAFTGCPPVFEEIHAGLATGALPDVPVSFTRFGSGIQAIAACTIALSPVYDDPLAAVPGRTA
ncbi:ROK family transcriptional regulator [Nocardioides montaniterrae]